MICHGIILICQFIELTFPLKYLQANRKWSTHRREARDSSQILSQNHVKRAQWLTQQISSRQDFLLFVDFVLILDFSSLDTFSDALSKIAVCSIYLFRLCCVAIYCPKKKPSNSGIFMNSTPSSLALSSNFIHFLVSSSIKFHIY